MTPPKRWPDHANWAREDAIARMGRIVGVCNKLVKLPLPEKVKSSVLEIKIWAMETERDMEQVRK